MKKLMGILFIWFAVLALFGCSDGGGGGGGGGGTGSAAYTATDPATSVSLAVPEGAYDTTKTQPKFTVTKNVAPLPAGNPVAANGGAVGDVFVITTDYADDFMQPVEVTVPYNPANNALPTVVYYDSANGVYVPVDVLNIGANTVTFSTVHFSTYASATHSGMNTATANISSFAVDSGFVPLNDGFDVANFGNFVSPDGSGLGMANFAAWYYSYKKGLNGKLYNKYAPTVERALIASIQSSAANIWKRAWNSSNNSLSNKQVGMLMLMNMKLTNTPQIFILKSVDSNNKTDFAHVTLAYKFVPDPAAADAGTFYLYDPNFPGEEVTIYFSLANGFTGYSKAGAFSQTFTKYVYSSPSNIGSYRQFQAAFQAAENGLGSITLTVPAVNASDVASITVTSAALPDVTVTGTVSNATTMQQMYYTLNGGAPVALGSSTNFTFTLPGAQLTNPSSVAIYGLSNTANPWSIVAYRQISLNFTGTTITSFGNIGFESADMSSWLVESRMGSQLDPTTSVLAAATDKSPFEKISATTVVPWASPDYGTTCPGGKLADGKGHCYDANGTPNPDYDPYWGMLTAFNGAPFTPGKSGITQQSDSDDRVGTLFKLVNNGNFSLRLNNFDSGYHVSTASQTATIPTVALPTLKFAWAAVLDDPGHPLYDQPYVQVLVKDITANKILYYKRFASNDPTYSGWINSGSWRLIPWQTVSLDVSSAKGNQVMISVTGADCAQTGHGGYVYLDDSP